MFGPYKRLVVGSSGASSLALTTSKWAKVAKCSPDTALRDIDDLIRRGVLAREPARGRSTHDLMPIDRVGPQPKDTA
jgi:hypothetical protein